MRFVFSTLSRRGFAASVAAGVTAAASRRVVGANDRVRVGFIGVANRGTQLIDAFRQLPDVEPTALCDVDKSALAMANARFDGALDTYGDFRHMLDRKDIDAVVVATPDHWHALQTIAACRAGKDVYVEKPLSMTVYEGRRMVQVARETKRVVQVGLHRRSSPLFAEVAGLVRDDLLGKVTVSRGYHLSNMFPSGIGRATSADPPADLDWDMWLGPRPARPFQENIAPYKFRWWDLYSSQMANNGVHSIDIARWMTGDEAPLRIVALGGRYAVDDDRTIPDTLETTFELPGGRLLVFGQYEANGNPMLPHPGFCELRGTRGTAYFQESAVRVIPEKGGQFQQRGPRMEPREILAPDIALDAKGNANLSLTARHARNFIDCMRSRELPACDVEVGHRSTCFALLANIALATKSCLEWNAATERFVGNDAANALLHYEYRKPWSLDR
ncbi:MAG: Gfo/Idh/MocA family protein [Planctomycetia bacterium]